jgi:hypothetical protein
MPMDKDYIDDLIALGTASSSIQRIQDLAAREMQRNGLGYTLHNACAATLSCFLNEAGIRVPVTLGAGRLAARLHRDRGWVRTENGNQRAGDIGVTFDNTQPPGADHVYLVVERINNDEMRIADNQAPQRHPRFVSGKGRTPTEYFLRAPSDVQASLERLALTEADYPDRDEDTNDLREPFEDDGSPVDR